MNNLYIQKCVLYCGLVKSYSVHLFCFQILSKCLCFLDLLSSSPILYIKYCKFYFIRQSRNTICVHSFPHTHTHTPFWLKQNSQFISNMIPNAKKSTATMHFGLNLCFVPLYFHVCIISLAPPLPTCRIQTPLLHAFISLIFFFNFQRIELFSSSVIHKIYSIFRPVCVSPGQSACVGCIRTNTK